MRLLLIGPPGGGKGTQGARIASIYEVTHIAAGDILRAEVAAGTPLGQRMASYMKAGELVPDDVILGVVMPRLLAAADSTGYVLDGFPRSVRQAVEARRIAEAQDSAVRRAVFLDVPHDELMARLIRRAGIEGRADDTPDVINRRPRSVHRGDRTAARLLPGTRTARRHRRHPGTRRGHQKDRRGPAAARPRPCGRLITRRPRVAADKLTPWIRTRHRRRCWVRSSAPSVNWRPSRYASSRWPSGSPHRISRRSS